MPLNHKIKELIHKDQLRKDIPYFQVGDTVVVGYKIIERNKERVQNFEGVVIARKHGGLHETITVRKVSNGIGVERIFPLHSPNIAYIKVTKRSKVRRAKLFYLRHKSAKQSRLKPRRLKSFETK